MKSTTFYVLTAAMTFFGLCGSVEAGSCNSQSNSSNFSNSFPNQSSSQVFSNANRPAISSAPASPVFSNFASATTPSAPRANLTVLPSSSAPVGKLQIASPGSSSSEAKNEIREVPIAESKALEATASTKVPEIETSKTADAIEVPKIEPSKIADAIKGLVGTWMAVSRKGDGELSTVELQLDDNGWAKLTFPGADGKPSTTTRKVEYENSELKLTGGDVDVMLGKLVTFNSRQMVLERPGGQVTFVRP